VLEYKEEEEWLLLEQPSFGAFRPAAGTRLEALCRCAHARTGLSVCPVNRSLLDNPLGIALRRSLAWVLLSLGSVILGQCNQLPS
jgi:hypothetical protein